MIFTVINVILLISDEMRVLPNQGKRVRRNTYRLPDALPYSETHFNGFNNEMKMTVRWPTVLKPLLRQ